MRVKVKVVLVEQATGREFTIEGELPEGVSARDLKVGYLIKEGIPCRSSSGSLLSQLDDPNLPPLSPCREGLPPYLPLCF